MDKIKIIPHKPNIKSKKILFGDLFLNKLTDFVVNYSKIDGINKFIHDLFYLKSIE